MVLDDVVEPADVAPLLARMLTGQVLVTSRLREGWHRLGARVLPLDVLGEREAIELLTRIATDDQQDPSRAQICLVFSTVVRFPVHSARMRLKMIFMLLVLYTITAAPLFLPGELRVVVQPATDDAVEVYYEPVSPVMLRSYEGIEPFNRAQAIAEQRAEAYPDDLAPPYIAHGGPYRLVAPYVTARGRALAAPALSGAYWSEGKQVRYDIVPQVRRVANSQAALRRVLDGDGLLDEPGALGMGIDAKVNRVVVERTPLTRICATGWPSDMAVSS
ncbi:hypothetical protein [Nonomuraea polychroma]|uniref:hypothetical protein n=1 Tax=Nonomuraea polychroma TaxID=46176 RepID=UPI000FDD2423|nr:hypothetical protein [Nonomuraea polychroma]